MKMINAFKEYFLSERNIGKGYTTIISNGVNVHNGKEPLKEVKPYPEWPHKAKVWTKAPSYPHTDVFASFEPEKLKGNNDILIPDNYTIIHLLMDVEKEINDRDAEIKRLKNVLNEVKASIPEEL